MKKRKNFLSKTMVDFITFAIFSFAIAIIVGISYLIYMQSTRIYTISAIVLIWIFGIKELRKASKYAPKDEKEAF